MDTVQSRLDAVRREHGAWTAHNIALPGGNYTRGSEYSLSDSERGDYFVEVATCSLGKHPRDLSVLDLGCLEGAIAVQFARAGAEVDGVDIRAASIAKASVVKEILSLTNLRFLVADALDLKSTEALRTTYDVIVCAGLLYHLDAEDQLHFLKEIERRCGALAIFDTHFAVDPLDQYQSRDGQVFRGRFIHEVAPSHRGVDRRDVMWTGLRNEKSFWLSESSLVNAIRLAGFGLVARVNHPFFMWPWQDRGTWIAYSGTRACQRFHGHTVSEPDVRPSMHPTVRAGYNVAV